MATAQSARWWPNAFIDSRQTQHPYVNRALSVIRNNSTHDSIYCMWPVSMLAGDYGPNNGRVDNARPRRAGSCLRSPANILSSRLNVCGGHLLSVHAVVLALGSADLGWISWHGIRLNGSMIYRTSYWDRRTIMYVVCVFVRIVTHNV